MSENLWVTLESLLQVFDFGFMHASAALNLYLSLFIVELKTQS